MASQAKQSKLWVLDTETKGTGAHVVPYEKTIQTARREPELALVALHRPPRPRKAPEPPPPLQFKVVDVMSSQVLGERIGARETVRLLQRMSSVLDARVFQWVAKTGRWRLLTLDERKALGQLADQVGKLDSAAAKSGARG
jgi:hypothetical protein